MGSKEKIKLTFLRLFYNSPSKYLIFKVFFKNFLRPMAVLGYLAKLKKGLGLAFCAHFLHNFFCKNALYLIFYQWTKFQFHTFFLSQDIKQNVIKFLFRQLMTLYTLLFFLGQPLKYWLTGEERGEDENTKIWISQERKELFRWNKKHLSKFLKGYHLVKNKNLIENSR